MSRLTTEQLAALKIDDVVGVAVLGRYYNSQGLYRVVGKNKVRIIVRRDADGYERVFSAKKGTELVGPCEQYRIPYLETAAAHNEHIEQLAYQKSVREGWSRCEKYANDRDIACLKKAVAHLEALLLQEK